MGHFEVLGQSNFQAKAIADRRTRQDRQYMYNVILRRVPVAIVAVGKQ
jgi:hypothetical protein